MYHSSAWGLQQLLLPELSANIHRYISRYLLATLSLERATKAGCSNGQILKLVLATIASVTTMHGLFFNAQTLLLVALPVHMHQLCCLLAKKDGPQRTLSMDRTSSSMPAIYECSGRSKCQARHHISCHRMDAASLRTKPDLISSRTGYQPLSPFGHELEKLPSR